MKATKQQIKAIKNWLDLGSITGEWACPFGQTSTNYGRNVGDAAAGKLCAEIFPEILPQIKRANTLIRPKICCHVCPCNLLGYDEVYRRAKQFVDAH